MKNTRDLYQGRATIARCTVRFLAPHEDGWKIDDAARGLCCFTLRNRKITKHGSHFFESVYLSVCTRTSSITLVNTLEVRRRWHGVLKDPETSFSVDSLLHSGLEMHRGDAPRRCANLRRLTPKVLDAEASAPRSRITPHRKGCLDDMLVSYSGLCLGSL